MNPRGSMETGSCPYCGGSLSGDSCPNCGTICRRCGTAFSDSDCCPECYPAEPGWIAGSGTHGEVAPQSFIKIVRGAREGSVSKRETEMLRGTFVDRVSKTIHDKVAKGCNLLNLPPEAKASFAERVEQAARRFVARTQLTAEDAVKFAILFEARAWGMKLQDVQGTLARAGFLMKLGSIFLTVLAADPTKVRLFVNGFERSFRGKPSRDQRVPSMIIALGLDGHGAWTARLQLTLQDALPKGGLISVRVENGYFLDSGLTSVKQLLVGDLSRCFSLFKTAKLATVDNAVPNVSLNGDAFVRSLLPSKTLPVSSGLMREAGCLARVERRFVELFRAMVGDSGGRSPQTLAIEALFQADAECFSNLSREERVAMALKSKEVHLSLKRDSMYTGLRGLLVPSEVEHAFRKRLE